MCARMKERAASRAFAVAVAASRNAAARRAFARRSASTVSRSLATSASRRRAAPWSDATRARAAVRSSADAARGAPSSPSSSSSSDAGVVVVVVVVVIRRDSFSRSAACLRASASVDSHRDASAVVTHGAHTTGRSGSCGIRSTSDEGGERRGGVQRRQLEFKGVEDGDRKRGVGGEMRRAKSLRIGVHHANAVVWEPVLTGDGMDEEEEDQPKSIRSRFAPDSKNEARRGSILASQHGHVAWPFMDASWRGMRTTRCPPPRARRPSPRRAALGRLGRRGEVVASLKRNVVREKSSVPVPSLVLSARPRRVQS